MRGNDGRTKGMPSLPFFCSRLTFMTLPTNVPTELAVVAMDTDKFLNDMNWNICTNFSYFMYKANTWYQSEPFVEIEKALSKTMPHPSKQYIIADGAQSVVLNGLTPIAVVHKTDRFIYERHVQMPIERVH